MQKDKVKLNVVAVLKIVTVCAMEADTLRRILSYLFFPICEVSWVFSCFTDDVSD